MNIVIVGASSGLGKALTNLLIERGHHLFLLSRSIRDKTFSLNHGERIFCDVRIPTSVRQAFEKIDKKVQSIDVLVNCAGVGLERSLDNTSVGKIINLIMTNLAGSIFCSREAYRRMLKIGKGHIVHISSTSGKKARELEAVYCATKSGLAAFSESLRLEAKRYGIRVTTVFPGGMNTNFYKDVPSKNLTDFMKPEVVAELVANVIESDPKICLSELVIERM